MAAARPVRLRLATLFIGALAIVACQPGAATTAGSTPAASAPGTSPGGGSPGPSDAILPPTDPIEGVVTHVDSTGLDSVTGFTLRAADGRTYTFVLGRLQNAAEFPPGHLAEHAANSEPILVTFEGLGPLIIATRIEDANPAPSSEPPAASATPGPS
jgi:hypothetical protein